MNARAIIITAPGINCDLELAQAFETAGAKAELVLLSTLLRTPTLVDQYNLIGLPGGFSYGDDVAAGRIMAQLIRTGLYPALAAAIERGTPMIAPCNGFQIAVQAGLLPGPNDGESWPTTPAAPVVSLLPNERGRFRDCWTRVEVPTNTTSVWTRGLACDGPMAALPSAHGEGRFVATDAVLDALEASGRVALRYANDENFNGSSRSIAGICDSSGLVFGLMPHPERFTRWTQHPTWTRVDVRDRPSETLGTAMFRRAVEHVLVC